MLLPSSCVIGQGHACFYPSFLWFFVYSFKPLPPRHLYSCSFPDLLFLWPILHVCATWLPLGRAQMKLHRWPEGAPSQGLAAGGRGSFTTGSNVAWGPPRHLLCSLGTTQPLHWTHPAKAVNLRGSSILPSCGSEMGTRPWTSDSLQKLSGSVFSLVTQSPFQLPRVFRGSSVNWMFATVLKTINLWHGIVIQSGNVVVGPALWQYNTKWRQP